MAPASGSDVIARSSTVRILFLMAAGEVLVGTSGYVYPHWRDILYLGVPQSGWLERYASLFNTVELNATFYRLPTVAAVERWRDHVPKDFVFAAKGSRYLTHNKKLTDVQQGLEKYFDRIRHLGEKLGPILWQLPPQLKNADVERLERFVRALPKKWRFAVEFRSDRWYTEAVCDVLDRYEVAFCEHDLVSIPPPRHTGGWRYLRFHGTKAHHGRYGRGGLRTVAQDLRQWRDDGRRAYVYFNNDVQGHALFDAIDLSDLLGQPVPAAASQVRPAQRIAR